VIVPAGLGWNSRIDQLDPAFSSADTSFMRESTLPRTTPSLASMRWIVGTEKVCQLSHLPLIDVQKRAALS
jgi:hypothetical protein